MVILRMLQQKKIYQSFATGSCGQDSQTIYAPNITQKQKQSTLI